MSSDLKSNLPQINFKGAKSFEGGVYEFEDFRLDPAHLLLYRGGEEISLTPKQVETLLAFIERSGEVVSKDELMDRVWPDSAVEESNLAQNIYILRKALGETADGRPLIETLRRRGYRFNAEPRRNGRVRPEVEQRDEATVESAPDLTVSDEATVPAAATENRTDGRKWVTAGVLAIVASLALIAWLASGRVAESPATAPQTEAPLSSDPVVNGGRSPAYDLYVRGKVKVGSENREDTEAAIKLLEQAIAIDPNLAEAHAQLARGYNTMAFKYSSDADRKQFHENAEVAIEKALALNPNLAEAHFARGLILWTNTRRFPHEKAIQSYKRSLTLDPNLDETHHQLSTVYSHIGLLEEAEESVNKALEINPNNTLARFRAGVYKEYQGNFDEALTIFKTIPDDFTPLLVDRSTAETLIQSGRLDEARQLVDRHLARFPQDEGGSFTSVKAFLLAKEGKQKEAEETILQALEIGKGFGHFHHTTYNAASTYAALNKPDEAVKWLEFTADNGFPNYSYFQIDPNLDAIRKHEKFVDFMTKLKTRWERFRSIAAN